MRRFLFGTCVLCAGVLAAGAGPAAAAVGDPADSAGPLDVASAGLNQDGPALVLSVRTRGEWAARTLEAPGRSLCLELVQSARSRLDDLVCVRTRRGSAAPVLVLSRSDGAPRILRARISRPTGRVIRATFASADVGLAPGAFGWRVRSSWTGGVDCPAARPCLDRAPDSGLVRARLLPPTPSGCIARSPSYRTRGPAGRRLVALTFDDGPSLYTHRVLDILERNRVHATFFVIGQQVRGSEAIMRRALRDGDAFGNHTYTHANVSGGGLGQLRSTQAVIRRATGYTPCVFRAPYGAVSGTIVSQARSLGMNTIQWDVDPRDWSRPGIGAIYSRTLAATPPGATYSRIVSAARPGSIILMHDGGGPRTQTLAALPRVIATLRRRGYGFATVPELLGLRPKYG
jgi:peptidoglycan/xylan/chitin deacetylase (PgdA/CDA1 family)